MFAGRIPSAAASRQDWEDTISALRLLGDRAAEHRLLIAIETHPGTLADTLESAVKLMREKAHAHIKINLDFLHLWEAGCPPLEAYRLLKVWTVNYHIKNISDIGRLDIYKPENVYSPSGDMRGTASLARGVINYGGLFDCLERDGVPHPLSLEWFGERPSQYLQAEMMWLRRQTLSAAPNNNQYGIEGARP